MYVTRQTAVAHLHILRVINQILKRDTGRGLRWRHIHGRQVDDYDGLILNWVVDQHRGQAKGTLCPLVWLIVTYRAQELVCLIKSLQRNYHQRQIFTSHLG